MSRQIIANVLLVTLAAWQMAEWQNILKCCVYTAASNYFQQFWSCYCGETVLSTHMCLQALPKKNPNTNKVVFGTWEYYDNCNHSV